MEEILLKNLEEIQFNIDNEPFAGYQYNVMLYNGYHNNFVQCRTLFITR